MDAKVRQFGLDDLEIRNPFLEALPGADGPNQVRQTPGACYSRVMPRAAAEPVVIAASRAMLELLELDPDVVRSRAFAEVFAGNRQLPGMDPYAMCYGGHQFGHWAGQLGDGRAINLGEVVTRGGEHFMLQLKGAGKTPYSRTADGLAVLRSSVREFLCSEAMHHLGVPTTRALSLVGTGETVLRDMFYDGHPRHEPGAVVCRVAPSFLRFGNFEIHAARGENDLLRALVNFTINTEFRELGDPTAVEDAAAIHVKWFHEVCRRTAELMVHWMRVGFVHGVMNTDNMSILGLTIDYGPYGWLEDYDPGWTPNTTDAAGRRYCFGNQPQIGLWNLNQLANALLPLVGAPEGLQAGLAHYATVFNDRWQHMMAAKLGLARFESGDDELVEELLAILPLVETDMTLFYRALAEHDANDDIRHRFAEAWYNEEQLTEDYLARLGRWLANYRSRTQGDGFERDERRARMNRVNPRFVLRNYLAQVAIDAAEGGDFEETSRLLDVLRHPYEEQPGKETYAARRPEWARHRPGCSMLSCSS